MKFEFFKKKETPKVEQDPKERSMAELVETLKNYGVYAVGSSYAGDNERRNALLQKISAKAGEFSEEEMKKACEEAHITEDEKRVLDFEISQYKKTKNQPPENL